MSKVSELAEYHLKKEKIVYELVNDDNEIIYMVKSIKRKFDLFNGKRIWSSPHLCNTPR